MKGRKGKRDKNDGYSLVTKRAFWDILFFVVFFFQVWLLYSII